MFKIGDFSKITNLTIRALHHYEELGLLLPEQIDDNTNYRYYSAHQLTLVNKIKMLQQIGLSLKVIKDVIQSNDMNKLEYHYELREHEIHNELEELQKKKSIVKVFREQMKEGNYMEKYNVELKEIANRKVMSLRKVIPSYDDEHSLWTALYDVFLNQHVKMDNNPITMTIYHDLEYKDTNLDIEVQSTIIGDYQDTDDVKFYDASSITIASVTFNGSFDQMPEVTQVIATWIDASDYKISGPMVNISIVSPAQDPNPDNWVTTAGFTVTKA